MRVLTYIICRKLHENERIWTPGGGRPWQSVIKARLIFSITDDVNEEIERTNFYYKVWTLNAIFYLKCKFGLLK